jgi:alkanesulfonate monooxygenase SsuD/methylene tetrahydromethanopterin reductase-like flavin-dependent oxidoreductase (luciferase family)
MKFGVRLPVSGPFANPGSIIQTAIAAEHLGFDFVTAHDHIQRSFDQRYHFSVGTVEAVDASREVTNFYESMTTFSYLAGMTKRIQFIPAAIVLPIRDTPTIVKQFQTAQALSGGRFIFCVCVGNAEKDFEVTQTSWEKRGEKMDDDLKLVKEIFTANRKPISYEGKYHKFHEAEFSPPVTLPIWIAARGKAALRRVAQYGTGWVPNGVTPEDIEQTKVELVKALNKRGRSISEIDICVETFVGIAKTSDEAKAKFEPTCKKFASQADIGRLGLYKEVPIGSPEEIAEWIDNYEKAGVNYFEAKFYAVSLPDLLQSMELFHKYIIAKG